MMGSLPKLLVLKRSKSSIQNKTPTPEPLLQRQDGGNCPIHRIPSWNYPGWFLTMIFRVKQINILVSENLKVKIVDRSTLILDIFCFQSTNGTSQDPGRTVQNPIPPAPSERYVDPPGKTKGALVWGPGQTGNWNRQKDCRDKIALLKERLAKIDKQAQTQRKTRRAHFVLLWLVTPMWANLPSWTCWANLRSWQKTNFCHFWIQLWEKVVLGSMPFLLPIPLVLFASCLLPPDREFQKHPWWSSGKWHLAACCWFGSPCNLWTTYAPSTIPSKSWKQTTN